MDEPTVERVAIAIWNDRHPDIAWVQALSSDREDYRGHARAAIEALGGVPLTLTPADALAVIVALTHTGTTHNVSLGGLHALAAVAGRK